MAAGEKDRAARLKLALRANLRRRKATGSTAGENAGADSRLVRRDAPLAARPADEAGNGGRARDNKDSGNGEH